MKKNWDASAAYDGIAIYPELRDANDKTVMWSEAQIPVTIDI